MPQNKEMETEASLFAMLLLMPHKFFKEDMDKEIDLGDDNILKNLANKYQVPLTVVLMRIAYYFQHKH